MSKTIGNAFGKIILMGEHAVVYDAYAIAMPFFATKVSCELSFGENTINSFMYHGKFEHAPKHMNGILTLLKTLKESYDDNHTYHININSSIPQQRGMGSSAAVANALIDAYDQFHQLNLTFDEKFNYSMIAETINHGKPSGIDSLTTMSLKPIYFKKGPVFETISSNCSGFLIVADSQIKGETFEAVSEVANKIHEKSTQNIIAKLDQLSKMTKVALEEDQLVVLGEYMNQAHQLLDELNVSHPVVNKMVKLALSSGAYGAKMTGGGKGGVMIAVAPSEVHGKNIVQVLKSHGFNNTWMLDLKEAFP